MQVRVVSHPDPDNTSPRHEHLWALVGGEDYCNGATAFYMGPDRDIDGDDLAGARIDDVVRQAENARLEVDQDDVQAALTDYRNARGTRK